MVTWLTFFFFLAQHRTSWQEPMEGRPVHFMVTGKQREIGRGWSPNIKGTLK
jgi:hypothetical protein